MTVQFMDGGVFHAPYGPRVAPQMQHAIDWLQRDRDTRKAWVQVWDPVQDLLTIETRDHPCTTAMQFMIRNDRLNLHLFMRANDAWRGFPYDVFQFCQLQLAVAECLRLEPGTYFHHATSLHLYEENLEQVEGLKSSSQPPIDGVKSSPFLPGVWKDLQIGGRSLFYGSVIPLGDGEKLMCNALRRAGVEGQW
ncbi:MAG: thymidylate synthase [Actinobacteria bacterium]|nr:thymidylate synthase [Actinomycetota bacterium]